MKTRFIGKLEVSPIGMGCMGFSHGYGQIPEEGYSIEAIRKAYDFGCTFFDTAETYGREQFWPGHNEQLVGKALEPFRKHVVLATKLHLPPEDIENGDVYAAVKRHLEASMKNLRTDYVDLYYLHRVNEAVPVEEIAGAMGRLIGEGLVRGWGMSQVHVLTLDKAHSVTPVTAVQNLYNSADVVLGLAPEPGVDRQQKKGRSILSATALVVLNFFLEQHAVLIVSEDHSSRPISVVSSVSYLSG